MKQKRTKARLPVVAPTDLLDLECSQVAGLTRTKTEFLLAQHKALIGFIVMDIKTGARHYIDAGAVRRLSCAEAYAFMKPESNPSCLGTGHLVAGTQHDIIWRSESKEPK